MPVLDSCCRAYQRLFPSSFPEHTRLAKLYDDVDKSEFLNAYFDHEYAKGRIMVERFLGITQGWKGGRTLDFGCGGGGLTFRVGEHSREAVGIDLDPVKIAFAQSQRTRLNAQHVDFVQYAGGAIPFPDQSFDTIFCVDVVEHLPQIDFYFEEFRRVLKPNGHLLISFGPPWGHAHGKHLWHRLPGWWTHLIFPQSVVMRTAGYSSDTTYEQLGMFRLSVNKFEKIVKRSGFKSEFSWHRVNWLARPLRYLPGIRELVISEVVKVLRVPGLSAENGVAH